MRILREKQKAAYLIFVHNFHQCAFFDGIQKQKQNSPLTPKDFRRQTLVMDPNGDTTFQLSVDTKGGFGRGVNNGRFSSNVFVGGALSRSVRSKTELSHLGGQIRFRNEFRRNGPIDPSFPRRCRQVVFFSTQRSTVTYHGSSRGSSRGGGGGRRNDKAIATSSIGHGQRHACQANLIG